MHKSLEFTQKYLEFLEQRTPFVVVTITSVLGSAPQNLGAKMLVSKEGLLYGTVGGGKVEAHCIRYAQNLLRGNTLSKVETHKWNLQKDIGMTCGGEVSFLFEAESNESQWNIAIFGAGHVSQSLVRALLPLDCHLFVFDNRKEWLEKLPENTRLEKTLSREMREEVDSLPDNSFIISMTMGHAYDVPILEKALKRKFPYVGVIGSKAKRNAIISDLEALGVGADQHHDLVCPMGEPIGTNDPAEISISIIAEILKRRDSI